MWIKMRPKSVILQSQKKLQIFEKTFFRKKSHKSCRKISARQY